MEIERKFLFQEGDFDYTSYPYHEIEQGYLSTDPVVRIRKQDDEYYLTYKGKGSMVREEYDLPLKKDSYLHLLEKADGNIIRKKRYLIPIYDDLTVELDIFEGKLSGLCLAEVEFKNTDDANDFIKPKWLGKDVTYDHEYHNSYLSTLERRPNV